jgi:hypothetical protein
MPNPCLVSAPANGALGNCPSVLPSGTECQFSCANGYALVGSATSCTDGNLTAQTCLGGSNSDNTTDGPIPLWALGALGAGLVGIASRRLKRAA